MTGKHFLDERFDNFIEENLFQDNLCDLNERHFLEHFDEWNENVLNEDLYDSEENHFNGKLHDYKSSTLLKKGLYDFDESDLQESAEVAPILDGKRNRKRYSRFRTKEHVCDFCNKSFTLKQNVQTHLSLYHMNSEQIYKPMDNGSRCDICSLVSSE